MRKGYLITAILLLSAVWVVAQTGSSSTSSQTPGSTAPQTSQPSTTAPSSQTPDTTSTTTTTTQSQTSTSTEGGQTIEGCLTGSAGNFILTDQSGKAYQLAGDTSKLSDHVNQEIRITGSEAAPAAGTGAPTTPSTTAPPSTAPSTTAPSAGAPSAQTTFNVKNVKMVSSTCKSASK